MLFHCSIWIRFFLVFAVILFYSCKTSGPGIFGKKSPHEQYGDRLINAGLKSTSLGSSWFDMAVQSISSPLVVKIPYKETGYFAAERPSAAGLRFDALRGQLLIITVERNPAINFKVYIDLLKSVEGENKPKHIVAADTSSYSIRYEVEQNASYILRIQPELLSSGEYTISIIAGASLAYPIKAAGKNHTQSFWGADRDGGSRKHEGIDMFAPLRTPVVAAANGRITKVNETAIGGKVVWLKAENKDYTLYYAHLDSQLVAGGERVQTGDTLGLMGNTGNARFTLPHLHFGIYTYGGAVDPFPFVNPIENMPEKITASVKLIGQLARNTSTPAKVYDEPNINSVSNLFIPGNTLLRIEAATSNWFKIILPNGRQGFLRNILVNETDKPLRKLTLKTSLPLLDKPDPFAAKKLIMIAGEIVDVFGSFENYYFIASKSNVSGWIMK